MFDGKYSQLKKEIEELKKMVQDIREAAAAQAAKMNIVELKLFAPSPTIVIGGTYEQMDDGGCDGCGGGGGPAGAN